MHLCIFNKCYLLQLLSYNKFFNDRNEGTRLQTPNRSLKEEMELKYEYLFTYEEHNPVVTNQIG